MKRWRKVNSTREKHGIWKDTHDNIGKEWA